jgi:reductive dehalogenase
VSLSTYLKHWAKTLGAVSAGITRLREVHLYSHLGRHEPYGEPVRKEHDYAIALTVEMDKQMLDHAPYAPTVMESARQYFNSAAIAVQLASWIRAQGYPARAHIDGDYRVVCPLVARDAGLGEIGRMGVLMTPELGPRVRLAVVTTNLPLKIDSPSAKASMIDFCRRCEKCARVCPAQAIPYGDRRQLEGAWRWQIDSEACFTYWCTAGTDCGRCVRVCPYSHPSNWMHDIIRAGIRRSSLLRALAAKADDGLYGKQPAPKKFK